MNKSVNDKDQVLSTPLWDGVQSRASYFLSEAKGKTHQERLEKETAFALELESSGPGAVSGERYGK